MQRARAICWLGLVLVFATARGHLVPAATAAGFAPVYESPAQAYEIGRKAFQSGNDRAALEPFRYAAAKGVFFAKYYLANILSDTRNVFHNPREAYGLYSDIVANYADVDPQFDYRARYVAHAYVMKGRYLAGTLALDGLELSPTRARRLFGYAATYLDYPDAQFEFARMLLKGWGGARNISSGKHYLSTLARKGHAGAQGYLAELFWIGEVLPKREDYALALSTLAFTNAPREDRVWIGDLHQRILCAASGQTRKEAIRLMKRWGTIYQPEAVIPARTHDAFAGHGVQWTCARDSGASIDDAVLDTPTTEEKGARRERDRLQEMHGTLFGNVGSTEEKIDTGQ